MPTRHSVYGGSNASMWLNCPGGVALRTQVPRRPAGAAAMHGSAQHEIMEQLLLDPDLAPSSFLGSTVLGIKIEPHHITAVELALEEYARIEEDFPDDTLLYSEREVMLSDEAYGTMDAGMAAPKRKRAAIIDFKFGQEEVGADTDQMMTYAVYARESIPEFAEAEVFELYIIQPALDPPIDKVVVPAAALDTFKVTIGTAIRVSKQPDAPYVEGSWCRYCNAKLVCPAKTKVIDTLSTSNDALDLVELGERLKKIKSLEKWAEEAHERLQHEIENGAKGTGWKLVAKRSVRKWVDEAAAVLAFKKAKIPANMYMVTELVSPSKAEKLIPKKTVNELATPVSSGNTIAPIDDKRPEVINVAAIAAVLKRIA
jgi:hypothetical protein